MSVFLQIPSIFSPAHLTFGKSILSLVAFLFFVSLLDSCKNDDSDQLQPASPADFFTLTVDPSFETADVDYWVMASSKDGEWIDVQPFASGETKVLNGVASDNGTFTLHFFSVNVQSGDYHFCVMKTITDIPVNSTWLLKGSPQHPAPKVLTVNLSNVLYSPERGNNNMYAISSNVGAGSSSTNTNGNNYNVNIDVAKSPADVLVTLYPNGYPKYAWFKNTVIPSTISLDASSDGTLADRTFTMSLPTNTFFTVSIEAFTHGQEVGYDMSEFYDSDGGSTVKLGYNQGFEKYVTRITCQNVNKAVSFIKTAATVEEIHTFPTFDINFSQLKITNFSAVSTLPYDLSSSNFGYQKAGMILLWNVIQPPRANSLAINFTAKQFPKAILDQYSFLPDVNDILGGDVTCIQYGGGTTYSDIINAGAQPGSVIPNIYSDNYFLFDESAN